MLKYGNRDFRNLQEQVYANMKNIQDIIDGSNIIADFKTVNIVGQVEEATDLPDPDTYAGNYGDAFLVGEGDEPADLYVFTKAYENENAPQWFNVGEFPLAGPQGEQGPQGEPGEGIRDASELLEFMEGSEAVDVALNAGETKVKIDLSTAEKAVIDNKLALPGSAPAAQVLVGINTSKEQNAIGIGDGLQIDSGAIKAKVGSGLGISNGDVVIEATEKAKIDNSLQLAQAAPASQEIVTINTSNAQANVGLESDLKIDDGKLGNNILVLDCQSTETIPTITEAQGIKLENRDYNYILVKNYATNNVWYYLYPTGPDFGTLYYRSIPGQALLPASSSGTLRFKYAQCTGMRAGDYPKAPVITFTNEISFTAVSPKVSTLVGTAASGKLMSGDNAKSLIAGDAGYTFDWHLANAGDESKEYYPLRILSRTSTNAGGSVINPTIIGNIKTKAGDVYRFEGIASSSNRLNYGLYLTKNETVYTSSAHHISLGTLPIYFDEQDKMYVKVSGENLAFKVLDQSDAEITVSNKSILDYKTGAAAELKLKVETDGTYYFLSGGLYESAKFTLGFTKPATAVGAIDLRATIGSYVVSSNILFAGDNYIDSIPTQYNGITRSSITAVDVTGGSLFKVSGSQITFGADTDVSLSFCLDKDLVKGIDATVA